MAEHKPGTADHGTAHGAGHGATGTGASAHPHGTMSTAAQEKTFAGFIRMTKIAIIVIVVILIFMALANA